jgi:reductive dehalogenase
VRFAAIAKRTSKPTYESDVVGPIERWDERDVLFARHDLHRYFDPAGPEAARYYAKHPEHREYDERLAQMPALGRNGGEYAALYEGLFEACRGIALEEYVDGTPASRKTPLSPQEAARLVKEYARKLGADLVGTGPLRPEWIYSHVGRSFGEAEGSVPRGEPVDLSHHAHAIAMGFRMDPDLVRTAPEFPTIIATGAAYALGAWVAVRLAAYIRTLGYSARAHHVYNYRVLAVPVAVDCGLGELSRAGFLITREFGLGLRLGVVTTELPMSHDRPVDIGAQSFCEQCEICADCCPSGAIPRGGKREHNGVRKWKIDEERCYAYWHTVGTDCSLCMSRCPWTKPPTWIHSAAVRLATVPGPHQSVMAAVEKLMYGVCRSPGTQRSVGLDSLRPMRLTVGLGLTAAATAAVVAFGVWWWGTRLARAWSAWSSVGLLVLMLWIALGVAVVGTLASERTPRPAWIAIGVFGGVAVLAAVLACVL